MSELSTSSWPWLRRQLNMLPGKGLEEERGNETIWVFVARIARPCLPSFWIGFRILMFFFQIIIIVAQEQSLNRAECVHLSVFWRSSLGRLISRWNGMWNYQQQSVDQSPNMQILRPPITKGFGQEIFLLPVAVEGLLIFNRATFEGKVVNSWITPENHLLVAWGPILSRGR